MYWGEQYEIERTYFGNILEDNLMNIWNNEKYQNFRNKFRKREDAYNHREFFDLTRLLDFFDIWGSKGQDEKTKAASLSETPPPSVCQTCYKRHGL